MGSFAAQQFILEHTNLLVWLSSVVKGSS